MSGGVDFYREVHKGLRIALFRTIEQAGRSDYANDDDMRALAAQVAHIAMLLKDHAHVEDMGIQPLLDEHSAELGKKLAAAHHTVEEKLPALIAAAETLTVTTGAERNATLRRLYLDLASFASMYVAHLGDEEDQAMPALTAAMTQEQLGGALMKMRQSIPPEVMGRFFRFMLPAMNISERAELLGGIKRFAPPPAFERMMGVAQEVLSPVDFSALSARLG